MQEPQNYLIYLSDWEICYGLADMEFSMYLFGDTFLRGQYVIHDNDELWVAFGTTTNYSFENDEVDNDDKDDDDDSSGEKVKVIALVGLIVAYLC